MPIGLEELRAAISECGRGSGPRPPRSYMWCGRNPCGSSSGSAAAVSSNFSAVSYGSENPAAILISVGSLKAVPRKLMPMGMPRTFAAGTLMMG
ncbi:MAG: hypothetical protein DMF58_04085 [Acidobacteria bacterium]|nr:MAG: hypothetical protein DMF58_04085 [Acidobacteriota bacterium]